MSGRFTLVEILIAMAILALSLGLAVSILGTARERVLRSERRWARQHNLNQLTEHYLLAGSEAPPPPWLLAEGYSGVCRSEALEDLPQHATEPLDGWILARWRIALLWRDGSVVAEHYVEKLVPSDEIW